MEDSHSFDAFDWRQICKSLRANCVRLSLSSLHFTQLFSQAVEDALRSLPPDSMMEAIDIAAEFDYETSGEVAELVRWVSDHSKCRFGIQWKNCISSCDQPCGIRRMRQ
jgi:hypothetical protein